MQKHALIAAAALLLLAGCAKKEEGVAADGTPAAGAASTAGLETDAQKFGYAIGVDLGKSLAQVKNEVDVAALKQGLDEALAGGTLRLTDEQREEVKTNMSRQIQQRAVEERNAKANEAKAKGDAFMAENAKRAGVKVTASGLQYEVLTEGTGETPTAADTVEVHYKGTLIDGTEFDSSYSRGTPVKFPLGNVIPGWTEGVQLMKPGAKYKFVIPAALAYGERGAGAKIGPNETLVFEVELLSVEKAGAAPAEPPAGTSPQ